MRTPRIVGFIGLGIMGGPMAANLRKAGHGLVVLDTRRDAAAAHLSAGAQWALTAREVAERCDVVFTCLPGLQQIEQVALGTEGLIAGIRGGQAWFDLSTASLELVKRLHRVFAECGAAMLDAPVSGGPEGARTRRLAIWVGGDKGVYERHEPLLRAMADSPVYIGPAGSGLVTKLVHNCASHAAQAAVAEAFVLGVKAGAEPLALWKAIRRGAAGRRRTFDGLANAFLPNRYEPATAALAIVHKDMKNATGLGRELGIGTPIADATLADIQAAMDRGWSRRDYHSSLLMPQERAGVRIEVDPAAIREVLRQDPRAETAEKSNQETTS